MAWPTTSRHERGYGTAHDKMRKQLIANVILCEECDRQGRTTLGTIADHILPLSLGGDGRRSNYQLLCKACSDEKTARDKGASPAVQFKGVDGRGRPTDANHPWNQRPPTPRSKL